MIRIIEVLQLGQDTTQCCLDFGYRMLIVMCTSFLILTMTIILYPLIEGDYLGLVSINPIIEC